MNSSSSVNSHLIRNNNTNNNTNNNINNNTNNNTNNKATKLLQSSSSIANLNEKFSAETLELAEITNKITSSIGDRLYYAIHPIHPLLAGKITAMFLNGMTKPHLENLLNDSSALQYKINEAIAVLQNHQHNLYTQSKNNSDNIRKTDIGTATPSVISSGTSTPICSVSMVASAASSSTCSINYLSSASNQSFSSSITSKLETISAAKTQLETKSDDTFTVPSICSMRTVRLIINAPVSKPMFQLLLQKECIPNPTAQGFEKIYVRCHKSYYHKNGTVIYTHFVNFEDRKYDECIHKLFDFTPYTTYYTIDKSVKTNIIDLIGNTFGLIECIEPIKQYPKIQVPVEYLSKMVKICLRCKLNESESRKRVCKYCITEEINDRKKIAQYYQDPNNKANHKSYLQIEKDLIKLKIEAHLIPVPMYKTPCNSIANSNEKKGKCTRNDCTYVHNKNEKNFGWKLNQIQRHANHKKYAAAMSQYELSSYQTIGLQFKYRRIICSFYEKNFKYGAPLIDNENNCDLIMQYLNQCKVKLHLIPLVYKSKCREEKCRVRSGKMCTFIHNEFENDRIFGDMLWRIKCIAKNKFDTESVQSQQSICDEKELLFDGDKEEKKDKHEWNRSPIEREWGYQLRPYIEAVNEERDAEIKELSKWTINAGNIQLKIETVNPCKNVEKRVYELFVIYEDDKDAKITPFRTYINFVFPCKYDVGLRRQKNRKNTKTQRYKQCPACYFNVCENEHWTLQNNRMVLAPIDDDDYYKQPNDKLQGVVVAQLKSINPNKKRYKVQIEKYGRTDDITSWLKFAMVASNRFNKKHRKDFENVHISYNPSNVYQQIEDMLIDLDKNKRERTAICKIIFGIQNTKPHKITTGGYNINPAKIETLFPRLNDSQIAAICGALNYNMHTIQGPPATGKTSTCAHIAYLWWLLNQDSNQNVKIHGVVPTNKGCLVLAQKCMEMNQRAKKIKPQKQFKVLYFASKTYLAAIDRNTDDECKDNATQNALLEQICVNVMAAKKLKQVTGYMDMTTKEKDEWKDEYIAKELHSADMIVTTFGNAPAVEAIPFSHAICDESNQGSLDTFLGIIRSKCLRHLCMAGDIQQLAPVTKSDNVLAKKSVYEDIISYLTNKTNKINAYYTRLNKQYRSHPQIYGITTKLFYDDSVDINESMYDERSYEHLNYDRLFANRKNHIQWHIYGQTQLDTSSIQQSKCNKKEAEIAVKYVKKFIIELKNKESNIAVISDYRAQIEETKRLLRGVPGIKEDDILLCTTNEIEGSSKPVVIYMCCRSNNTGNIGFLKETNRANVALSRAEYAQIIIGDPNTLQYNLIYNKIFEYHVQEGAVVCDNIAYNRWDNNSNWIKQVVPKIPLVNLSKHEEIKKRNDYHICSGCGKIELEKLFCGRSCSNVDLCENCMNKYLSKYCKTEKKLRLDCPQVIPITNIDKSDFFAVDSASGISLEFDILLGKYLIENNLILHIRQDELSHKLCNVATKLCRVRKRYQKYIPPCFRTLVEKSNESIDETCSDTCKALGIMRCKRNHLLQQNIMDTRFFQIVNKIRYNNKELKKYYNTNINNRYTFYLYKEFEQYQPTTIVVAYLQCCGYSQHISNRLRTRIGKELFEKNKNNPRKYDKQSIIPLAKIKIDKFADELILQSDQSNGIKNILSSQPIHNMQRWSRYIIELMQIAVITDTMGPYYQHLTHKNAIDAEISFGDKLTKAGIEFIAENGLKLKGFRETPDYYLKKPWIINYNGKRTEITWLDFKNNYCSSTEWNIDKLNHQAIKYNQRFGPGAFIFSLGFVKPPKGLQLNCYGLLAAVPLSKYYVEKFIEKRINDRMNKK